jgi:hypothetical protein
MCQMAKNIGLTFARKRECFVSRERKKTSHEKRLPPKNTRGSKNSDKKRGTPKKIRVSKDFR